MDKVFEDQRVKGRHGTGDFEIINRAILTKLTGSVCIYMFFLLANCFIFNIFIYLNNCIKYIGILDLFMKDNIEFSLQKVVRKSVFLFLMLRCICLSYLESKRYL